MRTDTETLIAAMRILAKDIESEDGIANAAIAEAADRIQELFDQMQIYKSIAEDRDLWQEEATRWRDMYLEYDEMLEGHINDAAERLDKVWSELEELKRIIKDQIE